MRHLIRWYISGLLLLIYYVSAHPHLFFFYLFFTTILLPNCNVCFPSSLLPCLVQPVYWFAWLSLIFLQFFISPLFVYFLLLAQAQTFLPCLVQRPGLLPGGVHFHPVCGDGVCGEHVIQSCRVSPCWCSLRLLEFMITWIFEIKYISETWVTLTVMNGRKTGGR